MKTLLKDIKRKVLLELNYFQSVWAFSEMSFCVLSNGDSEIWRLIDLFLILSLNCSVVVGEAFCILVFIGEVIKDGRVLLDSFFTTSLEKECGMWSHTSV